MQPTRFKQADFLLVEIKNAKSKSPTVSSGEERGLLSRTAAGDRAYVSSDQSTNSFLIGHHHGQVDGSMKKLIKLTQMFIHLF